MLEGAYCNALLFAHRSVCQKLNHVSSVQLGRSVLAFRFTAGEFGSGVAGLGARMQHMKRVRINTGSKRRLCVTSFDHRHSVNALLLRL